MVLRSEGKSYLGGWIGETDSGAFILGDVVEIATMIIPTPTGFQKRVTVAGLDYCSAPLKRVKFPKSISYEIDNMLTKDVENLIKDYEDFMNRDNLVKAPPKKNLVTP